MFSHARECQFHENNDSTLFSSVSCISEIVPMPGEYLVNVY